MSGLLTNGLPPLSTLTGGLTGQETIPVDSNLTGGSMPESFKISLSQLISSYPSLRIIQSTGTVQMVTTDGIVEINKTIASATAVTTPLSPTTGVIYYVKDGKGDAATNKITVTGAAGILIDGAATYVVDENWGWVGFYFNGTALRTIA